MEKPEGESIQSDAPMEGYTVVCKNRSFARNVKFSKESVDDAKKTANLLQSVVGTWGRALPITKEKFYAKFFNYGAYTAGHDVFNGTVSNVVSDASGDLIYDSQPFFSNSHPDKVGNTYDNYLASTSLSYANLQTAYTTYTSTNNRDERGQQIEIEPNVLLIPRGSLRFTAQEILESDKEPGVFDNTINVLRGIIQPLEWAYLTDSDGWFLGRLRAGLMATDRQGVEMDFYQEEETKSYIASIFTRSNFLQAPNYRKVISGGGQLLEHLSHIIDKAISSHFWKEISKKVQRLGMRLNPFGYVNNFPKKSPIPLG